MSTDPVAVPSDAVESPAPALTSDTSAATPASSPVETASRESTPEPDPVPEPVAPEPAAAPEPVTAPEAAVAPETDSAPDAAATEDDGTPKRKVRLSPTVDPRLVRPIPNLAAGDIAAMTGQPEAASPESAPPAEAQATAPEPVAPAPPPPPANRPVPVAIPRSTDLDAETEAELAAAMQQSEQGPEAAAAPAEEGEAPVTEETLASGAKLKGRIQNIDAENVFLEFGLRMTGLVPLRQFDPKKPPEAGAEISVTVDKIDEAEGLIHCHLPRGRGRVSGDWNSVVAGQSVECKVTSVNKGGLEVTVGTLRGFLPASQVELGYAANLESYVGQQLTVRVTEVNPARRRLILSRRALLSEEREASSSRMLDELQPGQIRTGVVRSLKDFGAFVDLGGIDGFLHVGQITWQRIQKPSDVLREGQSVDVKIVSVDREKKRIGLSLRQLVQNPWAEVEARYGKGTNVSGKVTRIEAFGAFIELEPGLEGLVHISELEHRRIARVEDVLAVDQTVELQVLEVDPRKKRISLSAKALKAKPESTRPAKPNDEDLAPGKGAAYERKLKGNLKGGIGGASRGGLFGDPRQFN